VVSQEKVFLQRALFVLPFSANTGIQFAASSELAPINPVWMRSRQTGSQSSQANIIQ
jgi:hypothetical protein